MRSRFMRLPLPALVGLLLLESLAAAQPTTPVPQVIRYDGAVELDGGTLDESLGFRFTLYNAATDAAVWSEEYSDEDSRSCAGVDSCLVPVYRGRFSVNLGSWADITDAVTGEVLLTQAEDVGTGGSTSDGGSTYVLNSNGDTADATIDIRTEGEYVFSVRAYQQAAGPDDAHITLRVDGAVVSEFDIAPTTLGGAEVYRTHVRLAQGSRTVGVRFTNDYNEGGDRNLVVDWFALEGGPPSLELGIDVRHPTDGTCQGGDNAGADCSSVDTSACTGDAGVCALEWAALAGRQPMSSLPYALWSLEADEFVVADTMTVSGSVATEGALTAYSDVTLTGDATAPVVSSALIHSGGDLTATSSASSDGDVIADGDLIFATDLTMSGQNVVYLPGSGSQIWNYDGEFAGGTRLRAPVTFGAARCGVESAGSGGACSLQVTGTSYLYDDLIIRQNIDDATPRATLDNDRPLFVFEYFPHETLGYGGGGHNTGISTSDYHCFIGGVDNLGGDVNEGGVSNVFYAFTYRASGTWRFRTDWASENNHELHAVVVWCFQSGLADMPATWFQ